MMFEPCCPYCGGKMDLNHYMQVYWYDCYKCRVYSPAAGTSEAALEKAMTRVEIPKEEQHGL